MARRIIGYDKERVRAVSDDGNTVTIIITTPIQQINSRGSSENRMQPVMKTNDGRAVLPDGEGNYRVYEGETTEGGLTIYRPIN